MSENTEDEGHFSIYGVCNPGQPLRAFWISIPRTSVSSSPITYPPEMLPSPDEGDEAEVIVLDEDGALPGTH